MDKKETIRLAREAIGKGESNDYVIAPTRHAEELDDRAQQLSAVLRNSEVETVARQYEEYNTLALQAQNAFKRIAGRANWAVLLSALVGTAVLVAGVVRTEDERADGQTVAKTAPSTTASAREGSSTAQRCWLTPWRSLVIALSIAGVLSGGVGSMWVFRVREGRLLERWMTARAKAETARLQYFERVVAPQESGPEGGAIGLALLQLEYFVRYQLEVQLAFYSRRGEEHRQAADRTLSYGGLGVLCTALGAGLGGALGVLVDPGLVSVVALAMVGAAVSSYASNKEATNQDRRNAERYGRTRDALWDLRAKLDQVRDAVASERRQALELYVASVHEHLSLEHRQWVSSVSSISATVSGLDRELARNQ
ncbi:MAG: hypothetical protein ACYS9X_03195 [Planctomycetota bacterium]